MKLCKDCKHWDSGPTDEYSDDDKTGLGLHICNAVPMFWDATEWNDSGDGRKFMKAHENTLAFVQDGSDYHAWLYTLPNFGCAMWEAK